MRWIALSLCLVSTLGCMGPQTQVMRLKEENAQLVERIRQDQVRVQNLEQQNRMLSERLGDAEKAVATLHDRTGGDTKLR